MATKCDELLAALPPERQAKIRADAEAMNRARAAAREKCEYEADFIGWCRDQAAYLRAGNLERVDTANVAEEIESWARHFERNLAQALSLLLAALLSAHVKPGKFQINSRELARGNVSALLEQISGLHRCLPTVLPDAWKKAVSIVATDLEIDPASLPATCPWPLVEVLREHWYPENQWVQENREAIESSNAYVEKNGLPLAKYRMF